MMYNSILVPLDGSSVGEQALPLAYRIAQQNGATLHVVHVHTLDDTIFVEGMPVTDDHLHSLGRNHERTYLQRMCARLTTTNPALNINWANPNCAKTVAHTLTEYVAAHHNDLVVMTTHGRNGLARFWLGSVADVLLRASTIPLLLVHAQDDEAAAAAPAAAGTQILIPLDGSVLAEQVLEPALALGAAMGVAAYMLLQVVRPTVLYGPMPYAEAVDLDFEGTERRQAEAKSYLNTVAQRLQATGASVTIMAPIAERPAQAILDVAQQHGPALIALATHGRSGFGRTFLGSIADKVVRGATIPVLVYRPSEPSA